MAINKRGDSYRVREKVDALSAKRLKGNNDTDNVLFLERKTGRMLDRMSAYSLVFF